MTVERDHDPPASIEDMTESSSALSSLADVSKRRMVGLTVMDLRRRNGWAALIFSAIASLASAVVTTIMMTEPDLIVRILATTFLSLSFGALGGFTVVTLLHVVAKVELRMKARELDVPAEALLKAWDDAHQIT